jgi:hypothetical protein
LLYVPAEEYPVYSVVAQRPPVAAPARIHEQALSQGPRPDTGSGRPTLALNGDDPDAGSVVLKRYCAADKIREWAAGSRCFCCFCRKLTANDIAVGAEILGFRRFGDVQNSKKHPPFFAVLYIQIRAMAGRTALSDPVGVIPHGMNALDRNVCSNICQFGKFSFSIKYGFCPEVNAS